MPDDPTPTIARQLGEAAKKLATLAEQIGHLELASTIRHDAKRRLEDGRIRAVVLGEIKHGKSSLINALLQDALLPTGVTPTTGAVVAVRNDPDAAQTGTFLLAHDGSREALESEQFISLARGKTQDETGRTPELLVERGLLPATLELIDTPGFNDIDRFRAALSRSELPRADVLVLVLDATQALSRSELSLIRDAIAAVGGLEDSGARCLLVINRIDLVPDAEREQLVEHIQTELSTIIPGELSPFLTDAKTALRDGFEASTAASAVGLLRDELFGLAGQGKQLLPTRARSALLRHARLLGYNAAVQSRGLRLAQDQLDAECAAVELAMATQASDLAELRAMVRDAGVRIIQASDERLEKFRTELEESARAQIHRADIHTLSQVVPGAIQDAFLEFVQHERESLRAELEQLTRDLIATCGELARRRLDTATLPLGFRGPGLYVEPPKLLIEAGMLALGLAGTIIWYFGNTMTGMVMTIASPLTTVILREKTVRDAREQARNALPAALDESLTALRHIIATTVTRHGEALDDHLMLADRTLCEQLLEGLHGASKRLSAHEARVGIAPSESPETETKTNTESEPDTNEAQLSASTPDDPASDPKADSEDEDEPVVESPETRLRRRISAAALAEFDALETRLGALVHEIEAFVLHSSPGPETETAPPVLH